MGHKRDLPAEEVVTTADSTLAWMPMEGEPANKTCRLTSK